VPGPPHSAVGGYGGESIDPLARGLGSSGDEGSYLTQQAFQLKIRGRYELAGPDTVTFDEAFEQFGKGSRKKIRVLHVTLAALRLPGRVSPYVRELADMMALFDAAGYAADPSILRDAFEVSALTLEGWTGGDP
jgi:uncharacterized protein YbjT (DUF2867 family)